MENEVEFQRNGTPALEMLAGLSPRSDQLQRRRWYMGSEAHVEREILRADQREGVLAMRVLGIDLRPDGRRLVDDGMEFAARQGQHGAAAWVFGRVLGEGQLYNVCYDLGWKVVH